MVEAGETGPARYVAALYDAFDVERTLKDAAFADQFYRTPGGEGYELTLERFSERLEAAGFGKDPRLELEFLEIQMEHPSWTPRGAHVGLKVGDAEEEVLHSFVESKDADRVVLPLHAPAADVTGRPVFNLGAVEAGTILVTEGRANATLIRRATDKGAVAILSSALFAFTVDPSGEERHLDAILFAKVPPGTRMPVGQISPRSHQRILEATQGSEPVELSFKAQVEFGGKTLRTLCATVRGSARGEEAVAISSHVQEPGAGDNASGTAGLVECATVLAGLLKDGKLAWPSRSVVFLWGDEFRQSSTWLDTTSMNPVAGISADMLGQSPARTGAVALLERNQDPGALVTLPPDEHTPWGEGHVEEDDLAPNGLSLIARTALVDVARHVGGWHTSENPWEGGSDHDVFLKRHIPAVLLWHFTDYTYHTSLDRMDMLDGEELRRSCVTVLATALSVAGAKPEDLPRYHASNQNERALRVRAAEDAGHPTIADRWELWCKGVDLWLQEICSPE